MKSRISSPEISIFGSTKQDLSKYRSSSPRWQKFMTEQGEDKFQIQVICFSEDEQEIREMEKYINRHWKEIGEERCWSKGTPALCYSENARKMVENGTHNFLGGENVRKRVANGTHNFLGGEIVRKSTRKRVANGTHPFLGGEIARKTNRKRVENGSHHLLSGEIQRQTARQRVVDGTHHFLGKGKMSAFNIETGEIERISTDLYHSRRDIYHGLTSRVFKEWKSNNTSLHSS